MLNNLILIYILIIVLVETLAQSCLKHYSNSKDTIFFFIGFIAYGLVSYLLCKSYEIEGGLGMINLIWSGISVITSFTIGILYFKEQFHFHDAIAILFITIGMLILKHTK
jgi:multidrug transporter EmrE-like cation transporter